MGQYVETYEANPDLGLATLGKKITMQGDTFVWLTPQPGTQGSATFTAYAFGNNKLAECNNWASGGTPDAPTPVQAGWELTAFSGGGYGGPVKRWWIPSGEIEFRADETFSDTAHGTNYNVWLTRPGTLDRKVAHYVDGFGNHLFGPPHFGYYQLGLQGEGVLHIADGVAPPNPRANAFQLYSVGGVPYVKTAAGVTGPLAIGASPGSGVAGVRAVKSADQTGVPSGALTKVTYNTEVFDTDNHYNPSTSVWTPRAGFVDIKAKVNIVAGVVDQATYQIYIFKNGAQLEGAVDYASGNATIQVSVSVIDQANGTDYYEVYVYAAGAGTKTIDSGASVTSFVGVEL
jgi:hypothetical protein